MKLNLEVNLDWIDEEMNVDETIKQNIIDTVVEKINVSVDKQVKAEIDKVINEIIVNKINERTDSMFNEFMSREVVLNDKYGSKIKVYANVTDVIKERFDEFMTQTVDEQGRTTTSTYGKTYPRLTFIIDKQLLDFSNKFTTEAVRKVSEEIKQHVHDGLTTKLGNELMKVLKVNEMLALPQKS